MAAPVGTIGVAEAPVEAKTDHAPASTRGRAPRTSPAPAGRGLRIPRLFTVAGESPYDQIEWEVRNATISGEDGEVIFEQEGVEAPKTWSQLAVNVVVSKYFRGHLGTTERETSVRQLVRRVVDTIADWGIGCGYFCSAADAEAFRDELTYLLLHQRMSFNSPVWFNCGIEPRPQCSACFINSVDDNMESILRLAGTEARLFKGGSGTGSNLSSIRSSKEPLSGGGTASGPVSFMKGYDAFAGVIKSGGKTRRAAKMVILNANHPDIVEFIKCKEEEERKAWALIDAGYDGSFNGVAYGSVFFQNANHSVRLTDEFMQAVESGGKWQTRAVTTGEVMDTYEAADLLRMVAEGTHVCGDPGLQFHTTINHWHTCANSAPIVASNPCSEYMFLSDSACNLASLNLMTFRREDGEFDPETFAHASSLTILAQEIIVDNASYPTEIISENSLKYRPLGLGYANLGALLMARGLPYNSDAGRAYAGAVTALMTGAAYRTSAQVAEAMGPFDGYAVNREPMLRVMNQHRDALTDIDSQLVPADLMRAARKAWDEVLELGTQAGFRNAQATVLAPTGTIGFMMDCDTTGVEPDIALVKYKKLVGGGMMKIVNHTVPEALQRLGYEAWQVADIVSFIDENDTIEGAPHVKEQHLPVFDCAFRPQNGTRSIQYQGHLKMMAAVQPFLSGAISKTVNVPEDSKVEEIRDAYLMSWKLGLKAVAIYRDNSKRTQPLSTAKREGKTAVGKAYRRRLPDERQSVTHKFSIGGQEGYVTVGMYEDGAPGEVFITMSKEGSTVSGLMDCFATAISMALQYGVPLKVLCDKFSHTRFEPSGYTNNKDIPLAKSIMDYIFRWLALKCLSAEQNETINGGHVSAAADAGEDGSNGSAPASAAPHEALVNAASAALLQADAPPCADCGAIMVRSGACYKCLNCGGTSGCS